MNLYDKLVQVAFDAYEAGKKGADEEIERRAIRALVIDALETAIKYGREHCDGDRCPHAACHATGVRPMQ